MRPKIVNQEREALYEDNIKQKLAANYLKDENVKLKTRLHMIEVEMLKKEKIIGDIISKPEAVSNGVNGNFAQMKKFESHLTQNLKRRIKEMQIVITSKAEELDILKRNMKTTRNQEIEVELRTYVDECTRLRS